MADLMMAAVTTNCRSFATPISFRKGDEGFILTNFKVFSPEKRVPTGEHDGTIRRKRWFVLFVILYSGLLFIM